MAINDLHAGLKRHVMVDFETWSTMPNAAPRSIGAVVFTSAGLTGEEFYINIDEADVKNLGLHFLQSTIDWWSKQSVEAREALEVDKQTLLTALTKFSQFVRETNGQYLWGNGADFDNPILRSCYEAIEADMPFKPYNGRCYRTVKGCKGVPKMDARCGTHHNALDDAKSQAVHLLEIRAFMLKNPVDPLG